MRFFEASFFEPNSIIFMLALLFLYNPIKYLISNKVDKQTQTEFLDESSSSDEENDATANKTLRYLRKSLTPPNSPMNPKLQKVID